MKTVLLAAGLTLLALVAAAWQAPVTAKTTNIPAPTFYKNVLPILQDHCQSCHRPGEVAPMPLVTYEQTRPWASAMAHAVEMKMMPPWFADPRYGHFANDASLTDQQIATIAAWATAEAPSGDPHDAPTTAQVGTGLEHSAARSRGQDARARAHTSAGTN